MADGPRTSRLLTLAVAVAAATLFGCDPASPPQAGALLTQPPVPDLSGLQPPLVRAIEEAARAVEANPDAAAAWGKLGSIYVVHDFTAESVACLEQAARRDPGEFRWPYLVGKAVLLDDHAASLSAFRRAHALRDDYAPLEALIGRALLLQGDLDAAEAAFRRALAINGQLVRGHLGLGQIALERGDVAAAVTALERAREFGGQSQELHWALAIAHRRQGDAAAAARAEAAAERATVSDELLPDPIYQELIATLGVTLARRNLQVTRYLEQGNREAALGVWEAAVRADPEWADPVIKLGLLRAKLGDTDGAIEMLERGLQLDPEQHQARSSLGGLLVKSGAIDEGIALLRASAAATPENPDARFKLAMGLARAERRAEAIETLGQTLELAPENPDARFARGVLLAMEGRLGDAEAEFEIAIDLEPTRTEAHINLARALSQQGRLDEAASVLRSARDLLPHQIEITLALAWVLATAPDERLRDGRAAMKLLRPLLQRRRAPRLLDAYAAAQAATGDFAAAIRTADEAIAALRRAGPGGATLLAEVESRRALYARKRPFLVVPERGQ
ncbi:MAG: tetratricopeptide repeat protein [Deltaproteobacteria bacterium]|jgi:tetratricopeptide (TPR) repeat protein|nr:tetratricopeptide repeat protein [Deltaproteobacteria bacterium]